MERQLNQSPDTTHTLSSSLLFLTIFSLCTLYSQLVSLLLVLSTHKNAPRPTDQLVTLGRIFTFTFAYACSSFCLLLRLLLTVSRIKMKVKHLYLHQISLGDYDGASSGTLAAAL